MVHLPRHGKFQQNPIMADFVILDEFHYHRRLAQGRGNALVLFSSPTCATCRVVEGLLPDAAPPGTALFKVDVQQATALARAFDVFHLPGLLLYRSGHFHARLDCEVTPGRLREAMRTALSRPAEEEP
jgi:thioredoxin 1